MVSEPIDPARELARPDYSIGYIGRVKNQKSERHHWWPKSVSARWKDRTGCVHWLSPDGEVKRAPPENFGVIGNGHFMKLGNDPTAATPWDENFESMFQEADSAFPEVMSWLESLDRKTDVDPSDTPARYQALSTSDDRLRTLTESVVSLVVRSPMNRAAACGMAERFGSPMTSRDRNNVIGLNMRRMQRVVADRIRANAKFCVLFSPDRELVFGDGFFTNIRSPGDHLMTHKVLAPITPNMAVLIARPQSCRQDPKLMTIAIQPSEADILNNTVQVYAKDAIFYRSERPEITDAFASRQHFHYYQPGNSIEEFIHTLPGVLPRDRSMDALAALFDRD